MYLAVVGAAQLVGSLLTERLVMVGLGAAAHSVSTCRSREGIYRGTVPSELVASVSDSLLHLLLSRLGGVGSDVLLGLGGEIFATGVRHVDVCLGWWFGL